MAEYLIQDTTLDAIADAINAKTGGTSAMTPAEMVTEIGSIQTGGGEGLTVLADYTATEDVSSIRIDFTSEMQGYDFYMVVLEGAFNRLEYPCPAVNNEPSTTNYMTACAANTAVKRAFYMLNFDLSGSLTGIAFKDTGTAIRPFSSPINYVKIAAYYSDGRFKTGFNVKVYGGMAQ